MIDIPTQPVKTQKPARQKRKTRTILRAILVLLILSVLACLIVTFYVVPVRAAWVFGPASPSLSIPQRIQYSAMLLWYDGLLTSPLNPKGKEETFTVQEGESVNSIASHLEVAELIRSANAVTTNLNINFLRKPEAGRRILGTCKLMKVGRTLAVGEVALFSEGAEEPVAHAVGTYSIPPKR